MIEPRMFSQEEADFFFYRYDSNSTGEIPLPLTEIRCIPSLTCSVTRNFQWSREIQRVKSRHNDGRLEIQSFDRVATWNEKEARATVTDDVSRLDSGWSMSHLPRKRLCLLVMSILFVLMISAVSCWLLFILIGLTLGGAQTRHRTIRSE